MTRDAAEAAYLRLVNACLDAIHDGQRVLLPDEAEDTLRLLATIESRAKEALL